MAAFRVACFIVIVTEGFIWNREYLYTGARRLSRVCLWQPRAPRLRQGASIQINVIPDEAVTESS